MGSGGCPDEREAGGAVWVLIWQGGCEGRVGEEKVRQMRVRGGREWGEREVGGRGARQGVGMGRGGSLLTLHRCKNIMETNT